MSKQERNVLDFPRAPQPRPVPLSTKFAGAAMIALLGAAVYAVATAPAAVDFAERSNEIVVIGWDYYAAGATGVIVGPNLILTAKHVVRDPDSGLPNTAGPIWVKGFDGHESKATVVWESKDQDLALLFAADLPASYRQHVASLTCSVPPVGASIISEGHPHLDPRFVFAWGHVASIDGWTFNGHYKFIPVTAAGMTNGDSGGPSFDADGRVWGVLSVGMPGGIYGVTPIADECSEITKLVGVQE